MPYPNQTWCRICAKPVKADSLNQRGTCSEECSAQLKSACKYGDPTCPCQDGDMCNYEGPNPMTPPTPLLRVYMVATQKAMRDGQCVGERNEYYVTLGQLERIVLEIQKGDKTS